MTVDNIPEVKPKTKFPANNIEILEEMLKVLKKNKPAINLLSDLDNKFIITKR